MGGIGVARGIPALVDPPFIPADRGHYLPETELVLGLVWKGEARAYPFRILVWHEVVNDVIQGDPLLVTWCPLCFSGVAFDGRVQGKRELFGVSGKLYQSQLVMYDQTTESYWLQTLGKAVVGPRTGLTLEKVPIDVAEWGSWRRAHPETKVLSQDTGFIRDYGRNPYGATGDYSDIRFRLGVSDPDARLPAQTIVHGVGVEHTYKAYPDHVLRKQEVINDHIGGTPVLVFLHPDVGGPRVFVRRVQDRTLTFHKKNSHFVDREAGSTWSAEGVAIDGRYRAHL